MHDAPPDLDQSRRRQMTYVRLALRISGSLTVVLGGWCLWLAFATVHQPMESAEFDDWLDKAVTDSEQIAEAKTARPAVAITHVSASLEDEENSQVFTAVGFEPIEAGDDETVIPVHHETRAQVTANRPASGAWLTGGIEEAGAMGEVDPRMLAEIPAWKRTTKSLKQSLRTPSFRR